VISSVEGGHRAILFNRWGGVQEKVYTEGIQFRVPWLQWPIIYDCRTQPQKFGSPTGTKGTVNLPSGFRFTFWF
jgi:prohibitin 2